MALNPVISKLVAPIAGTPGVARMASGIITLGSSDTYVTGGFIITPQQCGFNEFVGNMIFSELSAQYIAAASASGVNQAVKLNNSAQGQSQILATATTATVTVTGASLTANTAIFAQLDDAATGGGGSGTWGVTAAVASVKQASATTFTITSTVAAPTNGGNFVWQIPSVYLEATSADAGVASLVVPFIALGI